MTDRMARLLYVGTFGVWRPALYGSQQRSERLARGLAKVTELTYACTGHASTVDDIGRWASTHSIHNVIVSKPAPPILASRWGNAFDTVRGLVPSVVPSDIVDRISDDLVVSLRQIVDDFDVVWTHRSWHAEAAFRAGFRRIVCDIDDFEHALAQQTYRQHYPFRRAPLHRQMNKRLQQYERQLGARFREVVVTKSEDLELLDPAMRQRYTVVPNGFDSPSGTIPSAEQSPRLLFVGHLGYDPNIDAILWLLRDIVPIMRRAMPAIRITVAGRGPAPTDVKQWAARSKAVIIESPESLDELYSRAAVTVAPIRLGHGTRIKVLEAAAYGRAMVATSEAARGHPFVDGHDLLLADTTEAFAAACLRLLDDRHERERLSSNARRRAEELGGWDRSSRLAYGAVERAWEAG
jgi:glycosyltransferase involved in cell wall biosynthesis